MLSLKCLRGGRGQPHQGLARRGRLCQMAGMVSVLAAGQGNPPSSLSAARLLSSHAHSSGRDRGRTSNICCCFGEVLVWKVIPAIKNYYRALKRHAEGRQSVPAQTRAHHHGATACHSQWLQPQDSLVPVLAEQRGSEQPWPLPHILEQHQVNARLPQCWGEHMV